MTTDEFRCICDPDDLFAPPDPRPRAVPGCPAHRARRAAQQLEARRAAPQLEAVPAGEVVFVPPSGRCVFCERIAGGCVKWLDHDVASFEPLNPVTPGHLLVVPRRHVADAAESPEVSGLVMSGAARVAATLGDCNIITSVGGAATQTIRHLHLHVVPRRHGDGLTLPWTGQHTDPPTPVAQIEKLDEVR